VRMIERRTAALLTLYGFAGARVLAGFE